MCLLRSHHVAVQRYTALLPPLSLFLWLLATQRFPRCASNVVSPQLLSTFQEAAAKNLRFIKVHINDCTSPSSLWLHCVRGGAMAGAHAAAGRAVVAVLNEVATHPASDNFDAGTFASLSHK